MINKRKHKCFDEKGELIVTKKEQKSIDSLKRLSKSWPKSIWIFAADGSLNIMKCNEVNDIAINSVGGVDQNYLIDTIPIMSDGGDW